MRPIYYKDIIKNIQKRFIPFLSIVVIAAMAVAAYLGINFSSTAMKQNAAEFYQERAFRDFEITSTMLLTQEDLEQIRNTEGVADVEGVYQVGATVSAGIQNRDVYVISLTDRINVPTLEEGRMPSAPDECVLQVELMNQLNRKLGDKITLKDVNGRPLKYLKNTEFTITGTVLYPDYFGRQSFVKGSLGVMTAASAFDTSALNGCFMKALVRIDKPEGMSVFDPAYAKLSAAVKERLVPFSKTRAALRTTEVRNEAQSKIDAGQKEADAGKQKLADARKQLDDAIELMNAGEEELASGKAQLDAGAVQLDQAASMIADGEAQLIAGKALLDQIAAALADAETALAEGKAELDDISAQMAELRPSLDQTKTELEDRETSLTEEYTRIEDLKEQVRSVMKSATVSEIGQEAADEIQWAKRNTEFDVGDPELPSALMIPVTEDYSTEISGSLEELIVRAVTEVTKAEDPEALAERIHAFLETQEGYPALETLYNEMSPTLEEFDTRQKQFTNDMEDYLVGELAYAALQIVYEVGLEEYEAGYAQYQEGKSLYDSKYQEYEAGLAKLASGRSQYENGRALYAEKLAQYEAGVLKLAEGKKQIETGEQEYQYGLKKYQAGLLNLEAAKKQLKELADCTWLVLDVSGNAGFIHARESADSIGKLGMTFAMIFILVGALVIYATVGKTIEEQRTLIGTQKALGFYGREVLVKYLVFGGIATFFGILSGTAAGYTIVQGIVNQSQSHFYVIDNLKPAFRLDLFLIVLGAGLVLACLSVMFAAMPMIRQSARELMQEKMPVIRRKKQGASNTSGSLYSRLIFRNLFSELGRVIITIVSIAGCCILLMIGFTLNFGVMNAIERQYRDITKHDASIYYRETVEGAEKASEQIGQILKESGCDYIQVHASNYAFSANDKFDAVTVICAEPDRLNEFTALTDSVTKETITLPDSGVIIQAPLAENYGFSVGDVITLYDERLVPCEAKIAGICSNYLGRNIFFSPSAYKEVFRRLAPGNTIYVKNSGALNDKARRKIINVKGYQSIVETETTKQQNKRITRTLTVITLLLLVVAGVMAYFVLLNLVNMHLTQKKRELTVMRINGFTVKEVKRYVSSESIITTAVGIVIGLAAGSFLGYLILRFLEQSHAQFVHEFSIPAALISAAVTVIFSVGINLVAFRGIRKLNLTDIE